MIASSYSQITVRGEATQIARYQTYQGSNNEFIPSRLVIRNSYLSDLL